MSEEWHPCLKQLVRCRIVWYEDGKPKHVEATNSCHVGGATVCPRVTAGSPSGEEYSLCGPPKHAEQEAAKLLPDHVPLATAYIFGHDWVCMDCQHALTAVGVRRFHLMDRPA